MATRSNTAASALSYAQSPFRGGYQPIVVLVRTPADEEETQLPNDTEEIVYGTEAEATRHAEQQAMRWVHDRTALSRHRGEPEKDAIVSKTGSAG
ncbi:hypothetical protein QTI33_08185 [Variovorax sp. J22P271]|uniref:hypothetical protein n=1 Tax=Variovorax davisae TaxID=3053515 RepID=UPI002576A2F2|nr:hypothetical protein [Variovorax sp. J22P271]MDM0032115.1 hypothetical protein [Variovorax sp. J22P271]